MVLARLLLLQFGKVTAMVQYFSWYSSYFNLISCLVVLKCCKVVGLAVAKVSQMVASGCCGTSCGCLCIGKNLLLCKNGVSNQKGEFQPELHRPNNLE